MFVAVFLVAITAFATPPEPNGGELSINSTTANPQFEPTVAMAADGSFVVAWTSLGQDGSGAGVFARRFASDGSPLTGEIQVPTEILSHQDHAAVASYANGDFVVVWDDEGRDGDLRGVFGRFFTAAGTPVDDDFPINATTVGDQNDPAVAILSSGELVVAWESPDSSEIGVVARLFTSEGTPVGDEIDLNTFTSGDQEDVVVAAATDGGFVAAWESLQVDGDQDGVVARRFDGSGAPLTFEIIADTVSSGSQDGPDVAVAADGSFVVAWETGGADIEDVRLRFFNADGTAVGAPFDVNQTTSDSQEDVSVVVDSTGAAIVVWESFDQDGDGEGVFLRRFTSTGADGDESQVNVTTMNDQDTPVIATDDRGRYVVVWSSFDQGGDIVGRLLDSWLFADGFESADTSAWSATVP